MGKGKKIINILACISVVVLSSCVPYCDSRTVALYKNCTNDTLFIGISDYDDIDSVKDILWPWRYEGDSVLCDKDISLWDLDLKEDIREQYICPDSLGGSDEEIVYRKNSTSYFFLVRYQDAKTHSWDEIREKKLYHKWVSVKGMCGKMDNNIKY